MKIALFLPLFALACSPLENVGRAPEFAPLEGSYQHHAMYATPMPAETTSDTPFSDASLWSSERSALFSDKRAARRGDILTVVIEIDERAEISNTTGRNRSGSQSMGVSDFFGIPQRIDARSKTDFETANAVDTNSASTFKGTGNVSRNEKITLRVAATIVEELPNGVLRLEGQQAVRVNFEMRELLVSGYVRPVDISRKNEITYDKIAGAQISYGGKGQISEFQQPRYGQQISDIILPF